jgi:hypothetical protein
VRAFDLQAVDREWTVRIVEDERNDQRVTVQLRRSEPEQKPVPRRVPGKPLNVETTLL